MRSSAMKKIPFLAAQQIFQTLSPAKNLPSISSKMAVTPSFHRTSVSVEPIFLELGFHKPENSKLLKTQP